MDKKYLSFPFELKEEDVEESGIFRGYGSVFGNKDAHGHVVVQGAFKKTLEKNGRNGTGVAMLYQHDSYRPIGIWTLLEEDKKGLKVEGQLAMKTQDGRETYELMKMKALRGLSIGYDTVIYEDDVKKKVRYLKEIDLWEVSPVTFGANLRAQITTVKEEELKELLRQAKTERELEKILRDSGFSKVDAQHFLSLHRTALRDSGAVDEVGWSVILDSLKTINSSLTFHNGLFGFSYEEKGIGGNRNLPLNAGIPWDATAAVKRIRSWAGGPGKDDVDFTKYRQAFVWFNSADPNIFGSYKLPFADVIGGMLKAKWGGVFRAMGAVLGARGGVAIPAADKKRAYNFLASYYKKFDKPVPDFKDYSDREIAELFPFSETDGLSGILGSLQDINE